MNIRNARDSFRGSLDGCPYFAETWDDVYMNSLIAFTTDEALRGTPLIPSLLDVTLLVATPILASTVTPVPTRFIS